MIKNKLFGGLLVLLLLCTCVGVCGASSAVQIPVQNDSPIGTWFAADNLIVGSYDVKLVINQDGTAKLTGTYKSSFIGLDGSLNEDLTWSSLGDNKYQFTAYGKSVLVTLSNGNYLSGSVNPVQMGLVEDPVLNNAFPFTMNREGVSPASNFMSLLSTVVGNFFGNLFK
jgi:hypothetical protein